MVSMTSRDESMRSDPHRPDDMQFIDAAPFHWRLTVRTPVWRPPTDVYEIEDAVVVRVEIAGMREEDFSIQLDNQYLLIRGMRPDVSERRAFHQMEVRFGEFMTEVDLPAPVIAEQVQATYTEGFLRVLLPKAHTRQVPIINTEEG